MFAKFASLFILTLLAGCVATDVGNPQIETEIEVNGYESDAPDALTLDNGLEVDSVFVKLNRFHLDRSQDCDDTAADFQGVVLVDVLNGTSSAPVRIDKDAGEFCRLRLQFTTDAVDGQPSELVDNSIVVIGRRLDDSPFLVTAPLTDELSLTGTFTLDEGSHLLQVGFFLNEWLDDDLLGDNATLNPEHPAYETFRSNVSTSARLFHDANRDGQLDSDEIAVSIAQSN